VAFLDEPVISQVVGAQLAPVMFEDPAPELGVQRIVEENARSDGAAFRIREGYSEAQASGAAAVPHGTVDADVKDPGDLGYLARDTLQKSPRGPGLLRFQRCDQRHAALGQTHQLR